MILFIYFILGKQLGSSVGGQVPRMNYIYPTGMSVLDLCPLPARKQMFSFSGQLCDDENDDDSDGCDGDNGDATMTVAMQLM